MTSSVFVREPLPILKISNSEMQMFKDCGRRWWLTYYLELGIPEDQEDPTGVRNLGARLHAALQAMYERNADPIAAIDEIYADDLHKLVEADRLEKYTKLQEEQDLAHAMLEGFLQWMAENAIDSEYNFLAAEQILEVESGLGPNVRIRGVLDQLWQRKTDGAIMFRDFKSTGPFESLIPSLYNDPQMKLYHMILWLHVAYLERTQGIRAPRTDGALWLLMRRVKRTKAAVPPFYAQKAIPHNREIMETTWIRVHKILSEIVWTRNALDQGADHHYIVPPRATRDCYWKCEFYEACPMFDDGSNIEGLLTERYAHRDPNERYLRDQQREKNDL